MTEHRTIVSESVEFAALGAPFHERGRRMDEGIAMMRAVWSEDPVNFEAKYIPAEIREMTMLPQPAKPIPMWHGSRSEAAHRRAVKIGDLEMDMPDAGAGDDGCCGLCHRCFP